MDNQREDFEAWFKTTKWYTGDNCTPKYRTYRSMLQAWQQAQKVAVPDGWVVVPREPTEAMLQSGQDMVTFGCGYDDIYKTMIEAGEKV